MEINTVIKTLKKFDQLHILHILHFINDLNEIKKRKLISDIEKIDFQMINLYKNILNKHENDNANILPIDILGGEIK